MVLKKMVKIIEKVLIIKNSGIKQIFDAIQITEKGIYTGHVRTIKKKSKKFEEDGFIPLNQIQKITILNEHGKSKDIDL